MTYLYIDDERTPSTDHEWVVVRSYNEAIDYLEANPCPSYISFDHDLGDSPTGKDIATWMVRRDLNCEPGNDYIPTDFQFNVHSANPVGRDNIKAVLEGYLAFRDNETNRSN
jgi:hypothetical protein